jgi:hypothetical protein
MTETGGFFGGGDGSCFIADGATNLTTRLRRQAGMVKPEARRTVRRVNILRRLPAFAEHLWAGRTTMGHLDVLAEVASHRRQEALDVFGRLTADQATVVGDAFYQLTGPDPCDAPVQRTLRQRRADALAELAASFLGGRGTAETGGDAKTPAPRRAASSATVVVGLSDLTRVSQTYASSASGVSQGAPIDLIAIRRAIH